MRFCFRDRYCYRFYAGLQARRDSLSGVLKTEVFETRVFSDHSRSWKCWLSNRAVGYDGRNSIRAGKRLLYNLANMRLAIWIALALSLSPCSALAAAIRDTVLICNSGSPCSILDQSTTGPASGSGSLFSGTASGSADATGGILHAFSSYSFAASAPQVGQVNGSAQFFDQLTIHAVGLDGTIGYLVPTFAITGSTSGGANAIVSFFVNASPGCTSSGSNFCQTIPVTGSSTVSFNPITFTFGQAFSFEMDLDAVTYYGPGGELSAVSDFSHTALLNGLYVFQNSDGTNPVPSQSLTFASTDGLVSYSTNGIVPEPSSVFLLITGSASLAAIGRKRKAF